MVVPIIGHCSTQSEVSHSTWSHHPFTVLPHFSIFPLVAVPLWVPIVLLSVHSILCSYMQTALVEVSRKMQLFMKFPITVEAKISARLSRMNNLAALL